LSSRKAFIKAADLAGMEEANAERVTEVLKATCADGRRAEELLPLVYTELRKLAGVLMAKLPPGNTLQRTALVHEAYLRLIGDGAFDWDGRGHFFAAAAQSMRRILVNQARRKARPKHGGDRQRQSVDDVELAIEAPEEDMLALNEALALLERDAPRAARVVSLRYFAGLSVQETALAMRLSVSTVEREWRFARAYLFTRLARDLS
jgi:RNA polymerase sigma factor (TIGR02999 family)